MLKLVTTGVLASALLAVGVAEAGLAAVPAPPAIGLLAVGAAVVAVGTWWRSRRK